MAGKPSGSGKSRGLFAVDDLIRCGQKPDRGVVPALTRSFSSVDLNSAKSIVVGSSSSVY